MRIALCLSLIITSFSTLRAEEVITPEDPQLGRAVDFYQDVFPILQSKCLACHSAAVKEGDLILENAEAILKGGASGEAVIPGKPEDSYLFQVIARNDEPVMPPLPNKVQAKALTPKELGIFKQWITEGAKTGEKQLGDSIAWQPIPETYKAVYSLALGAEQRFIYTGRGNRIFVYDTVSQAEAARLNDPGLLALRDGDQAIYGSGVAHRDFVHSLAVSPDGKTIASGGFRVVKLWNKNDPAQVGTLQLPAKPKFSAVDQNGLWSAYALENNVIQIWNMTNGQPGVTIAADDQVITSLTFGPEGKTIVAGTESGTIRISNLADGVTTLGMKSTGAIHAIASQPEGAQLLIADADNVIRVWNWSDVQAPVAEGAEAPKPVVEIKGHSQPITALKVLPARKELLSGSRDATVRLWNLVDGKQVFSQNAGGVVTAIAISSDGGHLAGSAENKTSTVWDRAGKKLATIQGNQLLAKEVRLRTDNQTVAKAQFTLADTALKEAEKDKTQREESLKKAEEQKTKVAKELVEAEKKATESKVKVDEAAKLLAEKPEDAALKTAKEAADKAYAPLDEALKKAKDAVTSADRSIELSKQSIETAKQNVAQRTAAKTDREAKQKTADETLVKANEAIAAGSQIVSSLHITGKDKVLITSGVGQPLQQWNLLTGAPIGVLEIAADQLPTTELTPTQTLITFNPNNLTTAWDISDKWALTATLGVDAANPLDVSKSAFEDRVTALAFSPDGTLLATGGGEPSRNGELMLWNVSEKKLVNKIEEAHSDTLTDIEFSRDGQFLVTGASDKFVKMFNVIEGSLIRSYEGHTDHVLGVSIKADQSSLASAGADKAIKIWNAETGEQSRTISNYSKQVTSIDYIGVTDNLISGSGDKTVKYHTASNGRNYRSFGGNVDYVYSALSTGDESLVIAAGEDGVVRIWNGKDGKLLMSFAPPQAATETALK
jgi:WD40 repeat protein